MGKTRFKCILAYLTFVMSVLMFITYAIDKFTSLNSGPLTIMRVKVLIARTHILEKYYFPEPEPEVSFLWPWR